MARRALTRLVETWKHKLIMLIGGNRYRRKTKVLIFLGTIFLLFMFVNVFQWTGAAVQMRSSVLPMVPKVSDNKNAVLLDSDLERSFLWLPNVTYSDKVAILTPVRNNEWTLPAFSEQLHKLTYPRDLISVHFGEDGSDDETFQVANEIARNLKSEYGFREASVAKLEVKKSESAFGVYFLRHLRPLQFQRRSNLARSRNALLDYGMRDNDWVLWIDADITFLPRDIIQQFLFAKKDVMTTSCLKHCTGDIVRIYDLNNWRETPESIEIQSSMTFDELIIQPSRLPRIYLAHLKGEGRIVPLDGVGGCALMVRAGCHREGLRFPEKLYRRHIETEGLAKMAKDREYSVVGLPFVEVFHYCHFLQQA